MLKQKIRNLPTSVFESIRKSIGYDLFLEAKDIIGWRKMTQQVANCLEQHQLYSGCVTGEATTSLYRDELYDFIHELAFILGNSVYSEEPRLSVVTGPILNVSSTTGRSIIVELYRERLLNLFYSPYRQAIHYRIGGWMEKERTGRRGVVEDVYLEHPHAPSAHVRKRMAEAGNRKKNPDLVEKIITQFDSLLRSPDILKIRNDSDISNFIFLSSEEIETVKNEIKKRFRKKAFTKENEKYFNHDYFLTILNELDIQLRSYPEMANRNKGRVY